MPPRFPYKRDQFPAGVTQRMAALEWLGKHRHVWEGREIKRFYPMVVSPAWLSIVVGLQLAGIYSISSCAWDIRVDDLIRDLEERQRAKDDAIVEALIISNDVIVERPEKFSRENYLLEADMESVYYF